MREPDAALLTGTDRVLPFLQGESQNPIADHGEKKECHRSPAPATEEVPVLRGSFHRCESRVLHHDVSLSIVENHRVRVNPELLIEYEISKSTLTWPSAD
jgi:hypothetical protein